MSGTTHAMVGANAVWLTTITLDPAVNEQTIMLIAVGAFVALLPDIEAKQAKIHFLGKGVLRPFQGMFRHRGFTHSFLAIGLVFLISYLVLHEVNIWLPWVITTSYASHSIIDGLNYPGVKYCFPWRKRIRLVPKILATKVKGPVDQGLFIISTMTLLFFVLQGVYSL